MTQYNTHTHTHIHTHTQREFERTMMEERYNRYIRSHIHTHTHPKTQSNILGTEFVGAECEPIVIGVFVVPHILD
jgi:hypothetical protein